MSTLDPELQIIAIRISRASLHGKLISIVASLNLNALN